MKYYKKVYHVFSNNLDEWFESLEQCLAWINHIHFEYEYYDFRIYEEIYLTKEDYKDNKNGIENCLLSIGNFPN